MSEPKPLDATLEMSVRMMTLENAIAAAAKDDVRLAVRLRPLVARVRETVAHIEQTWLLLSRGIATQKKKIDELTALNASLMNALVGVCRDAGGRVVISKAAQATIPAGTSIDSRAREDGTVELFITEAVELASGTEQ